MAKVAVKKKKKITVFDVVNTIVFILISLLILVPIWKVLVDSLDLRTSYEVTFTDGTKLKFGRRGEWTEVRDGIRSAILHCRHCPIPSSPY